MKSDATGPMVASQVPHVLLAGPNDDERSMLENMLLGQGLDVITVTTVDEAADAVRKTPLDIVVLQDAQENNGTGTMFKNLKRSERTEHIPVLFVCEADGDPSWAAGLPGTVEYIRRPFTRDDLTARVRLLRRLVQLQAEAQDLRQQLGAAQKMECVGALAAGVVHEFNNLMFSVMGFAEIARAKGGNDIEALRESAEISYESAKRATATAASLLAFSRQSRSLKSVSNINEPVMAAIKLLRRDIEKNNIMVEQDLKDLPETYFSFGPIQQVVLNLIINAWQSFEEGATTKIIRVKTKAEGDSRIKISVADTGKGIPEDELASIFEPFYTTKVSSDRDTRGGSGLGLSIVREVVRDHGGKVQVDSALGKGTTFTVVLPVDGAGEPVADDQELDESPAVWDNGDRVRVLVVDDEETNRRILTRLLLKNGHDVSTAANMAEAMSLVWSRTFDLITMDMVMPREDGVTNIRRLREDGIDIPILICTGHMDQRMIQQGMEAGANGVVMKPFSATEFLTQMHACLELGRAE